MEAAAKRKKASKADSALLAKFGGQMPPSLLRVLAGEIAAPNTGFHKIAMQAAITANALGWTEEQLVAVSEDVIEKHQSDGHRYNVRPPARSPCLPRTGASLGAGQGPAYGCSLSLSVSGEPRVVVP